MDGKGVADPRKGKRQGSESQWAFELRQVMRIRIYLGLTVTGIQ